MLKVDMLSAESSLGEKRLAADNQNVQKLGVENKR